MKVEEFRQELLSYSVTIQGLFHKLVVPICQKFEFTLQQLFILGDLYQKNDQTPRELSRQIGISPNNFASVFKKLEEEALVCRKRSTADKRVFILHLTEAGQRLIQEMENEMTLQYGVLFEQIPDEVFQKIKEGFEALNDLANRL